MDTGHAIINIDTCQDIVSKVKKYLRKFKKEGNKIFNADKFCTHMLKLAAIQHAN